MDLKQKTIARPVTLSGRGLHTGLDVNVEFKPAPENHGIVFKRVDLPHQPLVKALVDNVVGTSHNTVLEENGVRVGMAEHSLAAIAGLQIDNLIIELNASEMPILDGSSRNVVDAFLTAGLLQQDADREFFEIHEPIVYTNEEKGIEIMGLPAENTSLSVMIDYNSVVLGNQFASLTDINLFPTEIAAARTFVFFRELEVLWRSNLIKGGSLDNAMVILEREVSQSELDRVADLIGKPRVQAHTTGIISTTKLQFSNEPARHKLLDLIGDLALIGMPVKGKIFATRPGHEANVGFAKLVKEAVLAEKARNIVPKFNPGMKPVFDIHDIMNRLPHRPPFLLVDRIMELTDKYIIGVKNVTMNEPFFVGHFPAEPVMPGVLIVEAMAQCGGVFVLNSVDNPKEYSTYFLKIDNVRFKRKVVPGDTLVIKLELLEPIRRGIAYMGGRVYVGDEVVTEGKMMAQVAKNK